MSAKKKKAKQEREEELKPLDQLLLWAVRYGLFGVFILPFLVLNSYLYPWVTGKIWGLLILVEILFPLWILLAFRRKEFRPGRNALLWAVLIFFAVATLSMFVGEDPHRSLWSKPDRLTGMFYQYHLLAFFLMASTVWRGMVKKVAVVAVATAAVTALHGISQAYLGVGGGQGDRGSATLGNASYLAQFLVPAFFLTGWLFLQAQTRGYRWLWGMTGAVLTLGMLASRSRGALVALGLSFIVAAVFLSLKGDAKMRRWSRRILAGMAILLVLFLAGDRWAPTHQWLYDQRLSIQYFQEASESRRLLIENALKGIASRPVLGWGPENFESAYYYHYDPSTLAIAEYETRQDRPHNIVLELLNNLGVIGFLAYAAMFWFAWTLLLRGSREEPERMALALSSFSLIAFNLFVFHSPWSYIVEFLLLALIAARIDTVPEGGEDRWSRLAALPALAALLLSLILLFGVISPTIAASKRTARMILSIQHGVWGPERFMEETEALLENRSPYAERNVRAVASHLSTGRGRYLENEFRPALEKMAAFEAEEVKVHQNDYVLNLVTAVSMQSLWPREPEQQAALDKAIDRMRALAPDRQEVEWIDAQNRVEKGQFDLAEQMYRRAIELAPEVHQAHGELVRFHLLHGDLETGVAYLAEHRDRLIGDAAAGDIVGRAMVELFDAQDFERLYEAYRIGEEKDLLTEEWMITGAVAAAAIGETEEARAIAERVRERFPERAQLMEQLMQQYLSNAENAADGE